MTTQHFRYTDSHCHLDFDNFTPHLSSLLQQCYDAGIENIIVPAIGPKNWHKVLTLCEKNAFAATKLHPCLGIHPWFLKDLNNSHLAALSTLVEQKQHQLIAIGEAGIDGKIAIEENNLSQQIEFFQHQIALAKTFKLPLIVHHRRSHQDIVKLLRQQKPEQGGIIHAFSGSYQQACQYIDLGFKLGIGGTISYPRAEKTIKAIKRLPLSSLVLETDAPAMPLFGNQGKDNSPLKITDIFNHLSAIRTEPINELAQALEENIRQILPKLLNT